MKMSFVVLALVCGCGNLSNDDLVFLQAVPKRAEVALDVQTTPANALIGQQAEYYVTSRDLAVGINGGVGQILDFVASLGQGYAPTERTDNSRIWGPISDVNGSGRTIRLEIKRRFLDDGSPEFKYCLHAGRDSEVTGDVDCDSPADNGFFRVLYGSFRPQASGGIRSGTGTLTLDFDASERAGTNDNNDRGIIDVEYDFSRGGDEKTLHVELTVTPNLDSVGDHAIYDYSKVLDRIDFRVEFEKDMIGGGFENFGSDLRETAVLDASWLENGPGRGDVTITGGDVEPNERVYATECWNAAHERVYFRFDWEPFPARTQLEGDIAACPEL